MLMSFHGPDPGLGALVRAFDAVDVGFVLLADEFGHRVHHHLLFGADRHRGHPSPRSLGSRSRRHTERSPAPHLRIDWFASLQRVDFGNELSY